MTHQFPFPYNAEQSVGHALGCGTGMPGLMDINGKLQWPRDYGVGQIMSHMQHQVVRKQSHGGALEDNPIRRDHCSEQLVEHGRWIPGCQ